MPFGVLEFVRPWGNPVQYDEQRAYDVVVDPLLYRLSATPGSIALTLTGLGLLALVLGSPPAARVRRPAVVGAGAVVVLGAASTVGVLVLFDPAATGMRMLGLLVTGAACGLALAALDPQRSRAGVAGTLLALAVLSPFVFALWPLVYAVELMPTSGAAFVVAVFGAVWVRLAAAAPGVADRSSGVLATSSGRDQV